MPKSLQRLVGPLDPGIASGATQVSRCTPAAGTKAHIRYIKVTNGDASTHYLCVSIGASISTITSRVVDQVAIAAGAEYERWVSWPVEATEIVCVATDTAAKVTLTLSGDLYTLG